jgi:hypothetical protein
MFQVSCPSRRNCWRNRISTSDSSSTTRRPVSTSSPAGVIVTCPPGGTPTSGTSRREKLGAARRIIFAIEGTMLPPRRA